MFFLSACEEVGLARHKLLSVNDFKVTEFLINWFIGVSKATDDIVNWQYKAFRLRKEVRRKDGSYIRFDDNACVLLASKEVKDPKGTRIFGPIGKEVKENGFSKIASLAEEIY